MGPQARCRCRGEDSAQPWALGGSGGCCSASLQACAGVSRDLGREGPGHHGRVLDLPEDSGARTLAMLWPRVAQSRVLSLCDAGAELPGTTRLWPAEL